MINEIGVSPCQEALDLVKRPEATETLEVGQGDGDLRLVVGVLVHLGSLPAHLCYCYMYPGTVRHMAI